MKLVEIERRTRSTSENIGKRKVTSTYYQRDPFVSEFAKRKSNGICQLCNKNAPFKNKDGNPYLETHHIIWLSQGGSDLISNVVALCPNCHKKMHILNLENDKCYLKNVVKRSID